MRAVLFDIDGVLAQKGAAIAGAATTLQQLSAAGIPFRFITNTTSKSPQQMARELNAWGLAVDDAHIFNPTRTACRWLNQQGIERLALLVPPGIEAEFSAFTAVTETPQAVVVGDVAAGFSFANMNQLFRLLMADTGIPLIALGMTRYFAAADGLQLDVGPFIKALEYASGRRAVVMGKPDKTVFELALADMGVTATEAIMLGDDRFSDVLAAQTLGITGVLVRTGKYQPGDDAADASGLKPDHVIDSVAGLPALLAL